MANCSRKTRLSGPGPERGGFARGERGAVIILVLVSLLVLASLVIANQRDAFEDVTEVRRLAAEYAADLMAESALDAALVMLKQDNDKISDTPFEPWVQERVHRQARITIEPCNARLQLNLLPYSNATEDAMYELLGGETDVTRTRMRLLLDWMDTDAKEQVTGSEAQQYATTHPAYRPRNNSLSIPEELFLVRGWEDTERSWLWDHCTIWGAEETLNINFVSREIFEAMFPDLAESWSTFAAWRTKQGFQDPSELREALPILQTNDDRYNEVLQNVTVSSNDFRVVIEVDMPLVYVKRRYIVTRSSVGGDLTVVRGDVMAVRLKTGGEDVEQEAS